VIIPAIIVVLLAFAALVISGVKDSAKVAAGIFSFHIFTLIGFIIFGAWSVLTGHSFFHANLEITKTIVASHHGLLPTLFLAFSACLLGVSGFESSANFVEEQEKGVFKKTLRNMLIGVAIFNPLIALVVLSVMPVEAIAQAKDFLLAEASFGMGGILLLGWIAVDAFLVLCGAVLTSYIGVSGLVNRMALDDCLPSFLIKENAKGSHPRIIWMFFLLCTSILLVTKGDLLSLAGVYTISFLGVMTLFALGNLILRQTRPELKRPYTAPFFFVVFAFFATAIGIVGNSLIDPHNDFFFLTYFMPAMLVVLLNIYRQQMVGGLMKVTTWFPPLHKWLSKAHDDSVNQRFYIFIHHASLLYKAIEYVHRNENGWNITFVHCKRGEKGQRKELEELIPVLQNAGFYPHLNLQFEYIDEEFSADLVQKYAASKKIPRNRIFIGSIHNHHEFDYDDFGGVRIIS
jgi:amino acid transporter